MKYGSLEYAYAEPIARALVESRAFRRWILEQTKFGHEADTAVVLHEEMQAARKAATWWRSHFTERCRCPGCSGQETDLLAIFQSKNEFRFALHFEIKQPSDRFSRDQAANYAIRSNCWITNTPKSVLAHDEAATMLVCSALSLASAFQSEAAFFDSVITFEDVQSHFPEIQLPQSSSSS